MFQALQVTAIPRVVELVENKGKDNNKARQRAWASAFLAFKVINVALRLQLFVAFFF